MLWEVLHGFIICPRELHSFIDVTGWLVALLARTGPLAYISLFPVIGWIRSVLQSGILPLSSVVSLIIDWLR